MFALNTVSMDKPAVVELVTQTLTAFLGFLGEMQGDQADLDGLKLKSNHTTPEKIKEQDPEQATALFALLGFEGEHEPSATIARLTLEFNNHIIIACYNFDPEMADAISEMAVEIGNQALERRKGTAMVQALESIFAEEEAAAERQEITPAEMQEGVAPDVVKGEAGNATNEG